MTRRAWISITISAVAIIVAVGAAAWSAFHPSTPDAPVRAEKLVTYTLGAGGDAETDMTFTCLDRRGGTEDCRASIPAGERTWTQRITVPEGTWLNVAVTTFSDSVILPVCWISDETDHRKFDEDSGHDGVARCQVLASAE